jgi:DNA-3-methyladenine glycosylase
LKSNQNALPLKYYCQSNVVRVAKGLLGKLIFTCIEEQVCGGIISETEAYAGIFDRASHAFDGKRTPRNEKMYQQGGVFYVFRCYGVHNMLNVVTNKAEIPDAVLIRGIIPVYNSKIMLKRLDKNQLYSNLTNGPGKVAKALGIELKHNGLYLDSPQIWITKNPSFTKKNYQIQITPRIGIDYAGEDAKLPYRFVLVPKNQQFIQKMILPQ